VCSSDLLVGEREAERVDGRVGNVEGKEGDVRFSRDGDGGHEAEGDLALTLCARCSVLSFDAQRPLSTTIACPIPPAAHTVIKPN